MCSSTGKWNEHIKYLTKKANTRLYFVRRLKNLGASVKTLKETFVLFVRPILEMCAPLWSGALHLRSGKSLSESLERIQRNFCKLVFPNQDYLSSLASLNLQNLATRRLVLTKRFGTKMAANCKFAYLFPRKTKLHNTRSKKVFQEPNWKSN